MYLVGGGSAQPPWCRSPYRQTQGVCPRPPSWRQTEGGVFPTHLDANLPGGRPPHSSRSSGRIEGGGPRNMKSIFPPLAAIFLMTYFYRTGGGGAWPPRPPWIRYYPPLTRMTDVSKNITLPQTSLNIYFCPTNIFHSKSPGNDVMPYFLRSLNILAGLNLQIFFGILYYAHTSVLG